MVLHLANITANRYALYIPFLTMRKAKHLQNTIAYFATPKSILTTDVMSPWYAKPMKLENESLTAENIAASVAYCGLMCGLCFLADKCDGCKTANNRCDHNCSDKGCPQKSCCESRKIAGCWECHDLASCEKGIYSLGNMSKVKAFSTAIKDDGLERFTGNVVACLARGLSVEKGKDFDGIPISEVIARLRSGGL